MSAPPPPAKRPWQWLARRPLLLCTVCLLVGIVIADQGWLGPAPWAVACALVALMAILTSRYRRPVATLALLTTFALLGGFLHSARLVIPARDVSRLQGCPPATITGTVVSAARPYGAGVSFTLRAETVNGRRVTGRVRACTPPADLAPGDEVRLEQARISSLPWAGRAGEAGYQRWLRRQGIHADVTAEQIQVVGQRNRSGVLARAAAAIERAMPGPDAELYTRLLLGMVYGLEAQPVPEAVVEEFRRAGTVHLLVVSGAQVSMIVGAVLWLTGVRWRSARWWHLLPLAAAVTGLVLIVGLGDSVTRAVAMFALMALAGLTARDYDTATAIACAALVICLVDTSALFSLGFQLTFAATIGVVAFVPGEPLRRINRSPAPASVQALRYVLWGSVGAWVMVTPLLASAFAGFPLLGNVANLINVPLSGLIMVLGLGALPFALLQSALPWVVWHGVLIGLCAVARVALDVVMGVNWLAGSLPLAYLQDMPLSALGVVLWYSLVVLLLAGEGLDHLRRRLDHALSLMHPGWVPISGAGAVAVLWLAQAVAALPPGRLEVSFLPVGAGQCVVVRSPTGACMVVDAGGGGPAAEGGEQLAGNLIRPWLRRQWVRRLDLVVVSHWDADHYNALAPLLAQMRWGRALLPPQLPEARQPAEVTGAVRGRWSPLRAGGSISLGGGVQVQVLAPRPPWLSGTRADANNNSAVLRIVHGQLALLLPGDLQEAGLRRLERDALAGRCQLSAQVLCLPHHGRDLSDCLRLTELCRPRWVVASCDREADYYLNRGAEEAFAQRGARLLRTDREGAITFVSDGRNWHVRTAAPRR